eukprot:1153558-Pelagomonas_calceolata.AAC.6
MQVECAWLVRKWTGREGTTECRHLGNSLCACKIFSTDDSELHVQGTGCVPGMCGHTAAACFCFEDSHKAKAARRHCN